MLSKLRRWLREGAILLVLLAGVIILLDVWRSPQMPAMFDSTPLHTLDGETVTLASISEERPVLLYFWASWCGICRFTTPDVARLQSEGESVMTIALRSGNDGEVSRWLSRKRVTFPVVNDSGGEISRNWEIGTVAKLAMRQPFVLFKGLTFQKLCLPGAFRPGDHHNKMLRPGLCVVHASPQYL